MIDLDPDFRKFFGQVLDVKYVVGNDIPRCEINSRSQYLELKLMHSFNEEYVKNGNSPLVEILVDNTGVKYAKLSTEGERYAFMNLVSFVKDPCEKCPISDANNIVDTYCIEESIDFMSEMVVPPEECKRRSHIPRTYTDRGQKRQPRQILF